ncbi:MAG TPA: chemotaxis protein CheX [Tepidisphaeraceae bacterium]|nr:chemotaxis protein CheX [Tepidisphaeraceae bacterium]
MSNDQTDIPLSLTRVDDHNRLLLKAVIDAMETMAFISPEPLTADPSPELLTSLERAHVRFVGPFCGLLELFAPRSLAVLLVANLTCSDQADSRTAAYAEDALKEIANVTCGLLLRRITAAVGAMCEFDLEIPSLDLVDSTETWAHLLSTTDSVALDIQGLPLVARLTIDSVLTEVAA